MDEYGDEFITPEERLEKVTDILAKGALRLVDDGENKMALEEKPCEAEVVRNRKVTVNVKKKELGEFFGTKDIIRMLKISRTTLWRLRRQNKLFCHIIGNSIRYRLSDY